MTIINGKTHYKWPFSIAMLNYQRVYEVAWEQMPSMWSLSYFVMWNDHASWRVEHQFSGTKKYWGTENWFLRAVRFQYKFGLNMSKLPACMERLEKTWENIITPVLGGIHHDKPLNLPVMKPFYPWWHPLSGETPIESAKVQPPPWPRTRITE